jgi:hypothetical protein
MTATPTAQIDGRDVAMASRAIIVLRDRVLERSGRTFGESVALRQLAEGSFTTRDEYAAALMRDLPADAWTANELLESLVSQGFIRLSPNIEFTPEGQAVYGRLKDAFQRTTAGVYEGMDPAAIETAGQVLRAVRARAEALAAD